MKSTNTDIKKVYTCEYCNTEYDNEYLFIACGQMHVKNGDKLLYYSPSKKDNINPSHYKSGEIECIDAIKSSMTKDEFQGALKANILKYIWRFPKKKGIEDLYKAKWYLNRLISESENDLRGKNIDI